MMAEKSTTQNAAGIVWLTKMATGPTEAKDLVIFGSNQSDVI